MSNATENTRFIMCNALKQIRKAKKHPRLLDIFENAMEAHLEALCQEHGSTLVSLDHSSRMTEIYSDAYDRQKQLTHSACVSYRELEEKHCLLTRQHDGLFEANTTGYERLQEAAAKLASQTQTIIALHTVIKDQIASLTSLQVHLQTSRIELHRLQSSSYREIMQAEAISEERGEMLEDSQKLVVKQRMAIQSLTFELVSVRKALIRPSFMASLWGKVRRTAKG